ncbi:bone marrow stromal antigen 2 [Elephas maximus indicus]|uniref:bone marrow stromal antigen 2 n=1 Tax=Elephas maximus indicus TaxID=99487 RepID=UPI002115D5F0|nr:bone marrow stromal antigen 2 [Elephas maximus indicus]
MNDIMERVMAGVLLFLVVGLAVALSIFAVQANSEACKDGLKAQQKCQNTTRLLEGQLTQAHQGLRRAQAQAITCNRTVVNLTASLEVEKAQGQKKQTRIKELEGEIKKLNQMLQEKLAEVEQLRKEKEVHRNSNSYTSASTTLSPSVASELLLLLGLKAALL